jgi:hypothetical protein
MLVQAQLEMHSHHGKVVATRRQLQVERACSFLSGRLKETKNGLWIAKLRSKPSMT